MAEEKPAQKRIVIPYRNLHPTLQNQIDQVLSAREDSRHPDELLAASFSGAYGGAAAGWLGSLSTKGMWPMAVGAALGSTVVPVTMYKKHSRIVREHTATIASELKQLKHFDAGEQHHIETLRETHPFGFVNQHGDVVLVPKTRVQTALAKAQQTFLKHIVPGRFRFNLPSKEKPIQREEPANRKWTPKVIIGGGK